MDNIITVKDLCLWYGSSQALKNINIEIPKNSITALIGPSGCGKSTLADAYAQHLVKVEKQTRIYVIHGDDFHHGFVGMYEEDTFLVAASDIGKSKWSNMSRV